MDDPLNPELNIKWNFKKIIQAKLLREKNEKVKKLHKPSIKQY